MRENADQNNAEYGHFLRSVCCRDKTWMKNYYRRIFHKLKYTTWNRVLYVRFLSPEKKLKLEIPPSSRNKGCLCCMVSKTLKVILENLNRGIFKKPQKIAWIYAWIIQNKQKKLNFIVIFQTGVGHADQIKIK